MLPGVFYVLLHCSFPVFLQTNGALLASKIFNTASIISGPIPSPFATAIFICKNFVTLSTELVEVSEGGAKLSSGGILSVK